MQGETAYSIYRKIVTLRVELASSKSSSTKQSTLKELSELENTLSTVNQLENANKLFEIMSELDKLMTDRYSQSDARIVGLLDRKIDSKEADMFKIKNTLKSVTI